MLSESQIVVTCVGPGINPNEKPCIHGDYKIKQTDTTPDHIMNKTDKNILPYNGIKNWRCEKCFIQHRQSIKGE